MGERERKKKRGKRREIEERGDLGEGAEDKLHMLRNLLLIYSPSHLLKQQQLLKLNNKMETYLLMKRYNQRKRKRQRRRQKEEQTKNCLETQMTSLEIYHPLQARVQRPRRRKRRQQQQQLLHRKGAELQRHQTVAEQKVHELSWQCVLACYGQCVK